MKAVVNARQTIGTGAGGVASPDQSGVKSNGHRRSAKVVKMTVKMDNLSDLHTQLQEKRFTKCLVTKP